MNQAVYEKARKLALKDFRNRSSQGVYPYLQALDDILSYTEVLSEVNLGLAEIHLDQIVGTRNTGRSNSFASNFMPLLDLDSEFAQKWCRLYDEHMKEGIRDPIKVYEFMNNFFVEEGNKRVSILKYCGAVTFPAYITRLIPPVDDTKENKIYYEFLDFYNKTAINYLMFSQPGSYAKLTKLMGLEAEHVWNDQEKEGFRYGYNQFTDAFEKKGGKKLSLTEGDAFLVYLNIYGYQDFQEKSYGEIQQDIGKIWSDFACYPQKPEMKLILDSGTAAEKKTLAQLILPQSLTPLKVAFIHVKTAEMSSWTYGHELGRKHLEEVFGDEVKTEAYFHGEDPATEAQLFQQAVDRGNTVIFSTSPTLLNTSIKYAMKYPKVKILNCSLNTSCQHLRTYYGRLYEAKFLIGVIAGIMAQSDRIGYIADYPIYGMISNINAFALGVKMVNPRLRIQLKWSKLKPEIPQPKFRDVGISFISGHDFIKPQKGSPKFGLYHSDGDTLTNLAAPIWDWGVFYEKIIKSILNGTWKQETPKGKNASVNYWWGLSSGMVDIVYSRRLPTGTAQLVELLKKSMATGQFKPFSGVVHTQDGLADSSTNSGTNPTPITAEDIITMDWLADNVIGFIPTVNDLVEDALPVVRLQGIPKAKEPEGEETP